MKNINFIQKCLFFDIETTIRYSTFAEFQEKEPEISHIWLDKCKTHPNYKDEPELMYETYGSLYPEYSKIICISYGYFDIVNSKWKVESLNDANMSEKELLLQFGKLCNTQFLNHILAGYNITKFDLPFVYRRMLINNILPPTQFDVLDKKPWDVIMFDLCRSWTDYYNSSGLINFDLVCQLMGVPSSKEGGIKGENVKEFYYNGKIDEITDYCIRDVQASIKLALKLSTEKLQEPI